MISSSWLISTGSSSTPQATIVPAGAHQLQRQAEASRDGPRTRTPPRAARRRAGRSRRRARPRAGAPRSRVASMRSRRCRRARPPRRARRRRPAAPAPSSRRSARRRARRRARRGRSRRATPAWTPTASGSTSAPCSSLTESGSAEQALGADGDPLGVGAGPPAEAVAPEHALHAEVLVVAPALRALAARRPRQHRDAVALRTSPRPRRRARRSGPRTRGPSRLPGAIAGEGSMCRSEPQMPQKATSTIDLARGRLGIGQLALGESALLCHLHRSHRRPQLTARASSSSGAADVAVSIASSRISFSRAGRSRAARRATAAARPGAW